MSEPGGTPSRPWEPQHSRQESPRPEGTWPEGDRVFCLRESVPQLDGRRGSAPYARETRGAPPVDPALMGCLWLSASGAGVCASRTIALACERPLALLAMVGAARPDFRPLSDVRPRPLEAFTEGWVQGVRLAAASGWVQWGHVSTAGTNRQGQASRPKARRDGSMKQAGERRRADRATLVTQAAQQDASDDAALGRRRGAARPAERQCRADRLARLEAARRRVEAQAKAEAAAERPRRSRGRADAHGHATTRHRAHAG